MRTVLAFAFAAAAGVTCALAANVHGARDGTGVSGSAYVPSCYPPCTTPPLWGADACGATDWKCLCANDHFTIGLSACFAKTCSPPDNDAARQIVTQICESVGVPTTIFPSSVMPVWAPVTTVTSWELVTTPLAPPVSTVSVVTIVVPSESRSEASLQSPKPVTLTSIASAVTKTGVVITASASATEKAATTTVTANTVTTTPATASFNLGGVNASVSSFPTPPTNGSGSSQSVKSSGSGSSTVNMTASSSTSSVAPATTSQTGAALAHVAPGASTAALGILILAVLL